MGEYQENVTTTKPLSEQTANLNMKYQVRTFKALTEREDSVPYKICSFDIEASSSHGDFPIPVKDYKKLVTNILDYWDTNRDEFEEYDEETKISILRTMINAAFGFEEHDYIDIVYPKTPAKKNGQCRISKMLTFDMITAALGKQDDSVDRETMDHFMQDTDDVGSGNADGDGEIKVVEETTSSRKKKRVNKYQGNIIALLDDKKIDREDKLNLIIKLFNIRERSTNKRYFPELKGDKVTFIGSTFMKYGEKEPYLNHCIALDTCSSVDNAEIEQYDNEKDVLLAWTRLIQRENPDIITGYNIFGFDYSFMYYRAKENGEDCLEDFLKLSRNKDEVCGQFDEKTSTYEIERSSITIASGTHNLHFIKMPGRVQIDLYNYFRREYNLTSYKLDFVSGHFIGDKVKKLTYQDEASLTTINSKNLTGLKKGNYVHFEEIGHSTEYYQEGAKFIVTNVDETKSLFEVDGLIKPDMKKTIRWCLAKDDVTPLDLFRMTMKVLMNVL